MAASQLKMFESQEVDLANRFFNPSGYKGLYAFHKYWGKKPVECMSFLIENLSDKGDLVADPFLGFGLVARESASRGRRFIGCDVNPIAVEIATFLLDFPDHRILYQAIERMERSISREINESYKLIDGRIASHYLWHNNDIQEVWVSHERDRHRVSLTPTPFDIKQQKRWEDYEVRNMRRLKLFHNSRINSKADIGWHDLFTGRALRNIDLILDCINQEPLNTRQALKLILTAGSGQMSKMVFAITGRGKTTGNESNKIEVGSWVIGYWRPSTRFEINVWNCYLSRARKMLNAIKQAEALGGLIQSNEPQDVIAGKANVSIIGSSIYPFLNNLSDSSIQLLITDPPHGDRIPYLELSEMWNALIGKESDYSNEIVVSNAQDREKTKAVYSKEMSKMFELIARKVRHGGYAAILFNCRDKDSWIALNANQNLYDLEYLGCIPMTYSSGSVVQDNRRGSLKHDYVLLYQKNKNPSGQHKFTSMPGWSNKFPYPQEV